MTPMSEWIDVSIYAAMIVSYWFVFAGWAQAMTLEMVTDRNADWLAANHERAATLLRGRWMVGSTWFLWSCYAWGALSVALFCWRPSSARGPSSCRHRRVEASRGSS